MTTQQEFEQILADARALGGELMGDDLGGLHKWLKRRTDQTALVEELAVQFGHSARTVRTVLQDFDLLIKQVKDFRDRSKGDGKDGDEQLG